MARQRADIATRFQTAYRDDELLGVVREVALVADPDNPVSVSTRRWDRTREDAGHPDAPSARQIVTRLNATGRRVIGWPRIVELAFEEDPDARRQGLTVASRRPEQAHLTVRHLEVAMRRAATHLGRRCFGPDAYTTAVEAVVAALPAASREHTAGLFPTVGQIERITRGEELPVKPGETAWDRALMLAGLEPRTPVEKSSRKDALEPEQIIELYASLTGRLPKLGTARDFAAHNRVAMRAPKPDSAAGWETCLDAYRARLVAEGREVPADPIKIPRGTPPLDIPEEIRATLPAAYQRGHWQENPDAMIAAMADYLQTLGPRQKPTTADYRAKQRGRREWPSLGQITIYHGRFDDLVKKARAQTRP